VVLADGAEITLSSKDFTNSNFDNTQLNINTNKSYFNSFEHIHNTDNLNSNDYSSRGSLGAPNGVD